MERKIIGCIGGSSTNEGCRIYQGAAYPNCLTRRAHLSTAYTLQPYNLIGLMPRAPKPSPLGNTIWAVRDPAVGINPIVQATNFRVSLGPYTVEGCTWLIGELF